MATHNWSFNIQKGQHLERTKRNSTNRIVNTATRKQNVNIQNGQHWQRTSRILSYKKSKISQQIVT